MEETGTGRNLHKQEIDGKMELEGTYKDRKQMEESERGKNLQKCKQKKEKDINRNQNEKQMKENGIVRNMQNQKNRRSLLRKQNLKDSSKMIDCWM